MVCHTEEADEGGCLEVGPLVEGFIIAVVEPVETTTCRKIIYSLSIMHNYRAFPTLGQPSTRNAIIDFLNKYCKIALLLCLTPMLLN